MSLRTPLSEQVYRTVQFQHFCRFYSVGMSIVRVTKIKIWHLSKKVSKSVPIYSMVYSKPSATTQSHAPTCIFSFASQTLGQRLPPNLKFTSRRIHPTPTSVHRVQDLSYRIQTHSSPHHQTLFSTFMTSKKGQNFSTAEAYALVTAWISTSETTGNFQSDLF